jgi:hypothetical protein
MQPSKLLFSSFLAASLLLHGPAVAQSDNEQENRDYMRKTISEMTDYLDAKCGDFKPYIAFDDSGFDYSKNPTISPTYDAPSPVDQVTAGLYGIVVVCEGGEAASAKMRSKITEIGIRPGTANSVKLEGRSLIITYETTSKLMMGDRRSHYAKLLNKI